MKFGTKYIAFNLTEQSERFCVTTVKTLLKIGDLLVIYQEKKTVVY